MERQEISVRIMPGETVMTGLPSLVKRISLELDAAGEPVLAVESYDDIDPARTYKGCPLLRTLSTTTRVIPVCSLILAVSGDVLETK